MLLHYYYQYSIRVPGLQCHRIRIHEEIIADIISFLRPSYYSETELLCLKKEEPHPGRDGVLFLFKRHMPEPPGHILESVI